MMLPIRRLSLPLVALLAMTGATHAEHWTSTAEENVVRGYALVVQNCSGCHAVGHEGESPHPDAPPFRILSRFYPIDALEETFIESIDTGHPGMPVFIASEQQIADILDYIYTVME